MEVCRIRMQIVKEWSQSKKGYGALSDELGDLATAMLEVAGRLNHLSPTALFWIEALPLGAITDGLNTNPTGDFDRMLDIWGKSEASEAFPVREYPGHPNPSLWASSPPPDHSILALRLQGISEILNFLAASAKNAAHRHPGVRQVLDLGPADFGIMGGCVWVLRKHGHSLAHLREIASAVYRWGMGNDPAPNWARREEMKARKEPTP